MPETKIILYANSTSVKKFKKEIKLEKTEK